MAARVKRHRVFLVVGECWKNKFLYLFLPGFIFVFYFSECCKICHCMCVCVGGWCEGPIVRGCCPQLRLSPSPIPLRCCRRVVAMPRDIPGDISHKTSTQIYKFIWACSPTASCTACSLTPLLPPSPHLTVSQLWRWRAGRARFLYALSSAHSIVRIHETGNLIF